MDPDKVEVAFNALAAGVTAFAVAVTALAVAVAKLARAGRTLRAVIRGVERSATDDVKRAIRGEAEVAGVESKLAPIVRRETAKLGGGS